MNYYVLDKTDKKCYGPMGTKEEAKETLDKAIQLSIDVIKAAFPDMKVNRIEKMEEVEIRTEGKTMAVYEIISEDQFDDPTQIPEEYK